MWRWWWWSLVIVVVVVVGVVVVVKVVVVWVVDVVGVDVVVCSFINFKQRPNANAATGVHNAVPFFCLVSLAHAMISVVHADRCC